MQRRTFVTAAAAALAMPALARAQSASTLKFVPAADIATLDPVWSTASQTRDHALMVYDTLYGVDDALRAAPQMVAGHVVENDGLRWTLTLRDGLVFHDGARVLARDCVASIRRWATRDSFGQVLMAATDDVSASDDRTIVFRMKHPFRAVARRAREVFEPVRHHARAPRAHRRVHRGDRSDGQRPVPVQGGRAGAGLADGVGDGSPDTSRARTACRKARRVRKSCISTAIEWQIIPDGATASGALQSAEVDWLRWPLIDLVPSLRRAPGITVKVLVPTGLIGKFRFNHLQPPFDNPAVRRAVLPALSQADYMTAANGEDRSLWRDGVGFFCPGRRWRATSAGGADRAARPREGAKGAAGLRLQGRTDGGNAADRFRDL